MIINNLSSSRDLSVVFFLVNKIVLSSTNLVFIVNILNLFKRCTLILSWSWKYVFLLQKTGKI